jgi:hypothetical protein
MFVSCNAHVNLVKVILKTKKKKKKTTIVMHVTTGTPIQGLRVTGSNLEKKLTTTFVSLGHQ